jgi:2-polyprenyl-6-methoxyphenol hydroxylase-like FAD-dependent oxidoreductase
MTGLLVSYKLSREGIAHTLIGGAAPDDRPRLGESLNENTSSDFHCFLEPELRRHCFPKCHISLMHGRNASMIYLTKPERDGSFPFPREVHDDASRRERMVNALLVMHVDRITFDRDLYQRVRANPLCEYVEDPRVEVEFDAASDRVTKLRLTNGRTIEPSYVFDATGARSVIGRAAGVGRKSLSRPQWVIWTHMHADQEPRPLEWWQCGTNLMRLDPERDGFRGISWAIPIGRTMSIGLSVDADQPGLEQLDDAGLHERLLDAWAARGFPLRNAYPKQLPVQSMKHEYDMADRGFGANWLLAGGGYLQVWFPSSAGINTSLIAAHLAPRLLEDPQGAGALYEQHLRSFLPFHEHLSEMIYATNYEDDRRIYEFWSYWLSFLPSRIASHVKLSANELSSNDLVYRLMGQLTAKFQSHPLYCLGTWGFMTVRSQPCQTTDVMSGSFTDYFNYARFRSRSLARGWRDWMTKAKPQSSRG